MELWDIYNKNREKQEGKIERTKGFLPKDLYHLVVHLCIFNSKDELLIQHRVSTKALAPNLWDLTSGGSALTGENSQEAIEREVFEEIGLKVDLANIRPKISVNFIDGFDDVYVIVNDVDLNSLKLDQEEVDDVRWASLDEVFKMIDNEEFVPYHRSLIQYLYDTKNTLGMVIRTMFFHDEVK